MQSIAPPPKTPVHYPDEHDAAIKHLDFAIAEFEDMRCSQLWSGR